MDPRILTQLVTTHPAPGKLRSNSSSRHRVPNTTPRPRTPTAASSPQPHYGDFYSKVGLGPTCSALSGNTAKALLSVCPSLSKVPRPFSEPGHARNFPGSLLPPLRPRYPSLGVTQNSPKTHSLGSLPTPVPNAGRRTRRSEGESGAAQEAGEPHHPPEIGTHLPARRAVAVALIVEVGHAAHHPLVDLGQSEPLVRGALDGASDQVGVGQVPPGVPPRRAFPRLPGAPSRPRLRRRQWLLRLQRRLRPSAQRARRGGWPRPRVLPSGSQQPSRVLQEHPGSQRAAPAAADRHGRAGPAAAVLVVFIVLLLGDHGISGRLPRGFGRASLELRPLQGPRTGARSALRLELRVQLHFERRERGRGGRRLCHLRRPPAARALALPSRPGRGATGEGRGRCEGEDSRAPPPLLPPPGEVRVEKKGELVTPVWSPVLGKSSAAAPLPDRTAPAFQEQADLQTCVPNLAQQTPPPGQAAGETPANRRARTG